jgi:hypothetical protein
MEVRKGLSNAQKAAAEAAAQGVSASDTFRKAENDYRKQEELRRKSESAKLPEKVKKTDEKDVFGQAKEDLMRQLDLTKEATVEEKTLFETQKGRYKELNANQKVELVNLAKDIDLRIQRNKVDESFRNAAKALDIENEALVLLEYEVSLTGKSADERERLLGIKREEIRLAKLQNDLDPAGKAIVAGRSADILGKKSELNQMLADARIVNSIIDSSFASIESSVQKNLQFAAQLLEQKKINEEDFLRYAESQTKRLTDLNKEAADEITLFWQEAAKNMQSAMGDFFFDIMQGKISSLGDRFKQMLDRMVADALAANLAEALLGKGFSKTGNLGGWVGQGLSWLGGALGGTGRAIGGDVMGGSPYVVGEQGPEPFVPKVSGTIIPTGSILANYGGGRGTNVNFNITAMDSQDVARAIHNNRRAIADIINGTNRGYGLGV